MDAIGVGGGLENLYEREGLLHTMRHQSSVLSLSSIHVSCSQAAWYWCLEVSQHHLLSGRPLFLCHDSQVSICELS